MDLAFTKMNGAGNDFVMLDNRDRRITLAPAAIARLCDRHRGIGADGLLAAEPPEGAADLRMRYYNADGGEAEMCGNGARCFARFAQRLLGDGRPRVSFETPAGTIHADLAGELVTLRMSDPKDLRPDAELDLAGNRRIVGFLNTGVPHAVVFVDNLDSTDVLAEGRAARFHPAFAPAGTNANFVAVHAPGRLSIRTYERGVEGETLACGTGVCAVALAHAAKENLDGPVDVRVRGGDTLRVSFVRTPDGFRDVTLTGPADFVFEGRISL